jgi:hypothetical protein
MARTGYVSDQEEFIRRIDSETDRFVSVAAQLAATGHNQLAATMLAHTWIGSEWYVPLEVLGIVDLPAAHRVAQEISTG